MSVENAILLIDFPKLRYKLSEQYKEKKLDARSVLTKLQLWRAGTILYVLFLSVISFGIIPIIFFFRMRKLNASANTTRNTNFITEPWHVTKEAVEALEKIIEHENDESDTSDEDQSQTASEEKNEEVSESEESYQQRINFKHPLGPLLGVTYAEEDEANKNTTYLERTAAKILENGDVLACDLIQYQDGHTNFAIGVFDEDAKVLKKPLFRYGHTRIENNLIPFEYQAGKYIYIFGNNGNLSLCFDEGRYELKIPKAIKMAAVSIIPTYFSRTTNGIEFHAIIVRKESEEFDQDFDSAYSVQIKHNLDNKSDDITVAKLFNNDEFGDKKTHITAIACNNLTTFLYDETRPKKRFLYLADLNNQLIRVTVEEAKDNIILRGGDTQYAQLKEGNNITKIAVNSDDSVICVYRVGGKVEIYKRTNYYTIDFFSEVLIDPHSDGNLLDMNFVNDNLIIVGSKKVLNIPKQDFNREKEESPKPTKNSTQLDEAARAALLKHHSATQVNDKANKLEIRSERVSSHILSTGAIVACDKKTNNGNISYVISMLYSKNNDGSDGAVILETPNEIAAKYVPIFENGDLFFVVRDGDYINILNAAGQLIEQKRYLNRQYLYLIPVSINPFVVIEVDEDFYFYYQYHYQNADLSMDSIAPNKANFEGVDKPVVTYNVYNQSLYYVLGNIFLRVPLDIKKGRYNGTNEGDQIKFTASNKNIIKIAVSDSGRYLVTADDTGVITLYDLKDLKSDVIRKLSDVKIEDALLLDMRFVEYDKDLLIATNKQPVRIDNFEVEFAKHTGFAP